MELFGPYQLLEKLGEGGMGSADLARPVVTAIGLPDLLVVKRLHPHLGASETQVKRFQHEAELAVHVDSPHVAKVYDAGISGTTLYIAMEYVAGSSGQDLITEMHSRARPIPIGVAVELACQVLTGLEAIHGAIDSGFRPLEAVHRDLSPKNYMIGIDGVVRIIDLGLGKSKARDWQTAQGRVMGTPGYMAPEQAQGLPADRRADLYAAGVILYELLTLTRYIPVGPVFGMLKATVERTFVPPSSIREDLPPAIDPILYAALDPDPAHRPASAKELQAALEAAHPRAGAAALRSFAEALLGSAWDLRSAKVRDLISTPRLDLGPESVEATRVIARRVPPAIRRARERLEEAAAAPTAALPTTVSLTVDRRSARRHLTWWSVAVAVVLAILTSLAIDGLGRRRKAEGSMSLEITFAPDAAIVSDVDRPPPAGASPQALLPRHEPPPPAPPSRAPLSKAPPSKAPAEPPPPASPASPEPTIEGLAARIEALARRNPNDEDVAKLTADIGWERKYPEMTDQKRKNLRRIDGDLRRLETELGSR
jgi:serine/threonine-protein kinase